MSDIPEFIPLGDAALQIVFGDCIETSSNQRALTLATALAGLPGITDKVPAYASLTVHYDPLCWSHAELIEALQPLLAGGDGGGTSSRILSIPICYGAEYGPDLERVAEHCGLSPEDVIARHSEAVYRVHFLGFTPGFPYLGGLNPALATPRRATPRVRVPAGAVGIAGAQTGIYPQSGPGGWQLIGLTPLPLFDPRRESPCLLAPGDSLRFEPITAQEFEHLLQGLGA